MNPPAFQFYADDFIGGTVAMSAEECGAYIRLLCYQWGKGSIPETQALLDRIAGASVTETVLDKFPGRKNPRLEFERRKQIEYRAKQAINGAKGGRPAKPKPNPSLSFGLTQMKPKKSSPSPSPSPYKEEGNGAPLSSEIAKILDEWNAGNLPKCLVVSDKRRRTLEVRLREPFFALNWTQAMARIQSSTFCHGENNRGWRASFEWFISPDAVTKIMEGKYDNRQHKPEQNMNKVW